MEWDLNFSKFTDIRKKTHGKDADVEGRRTDQKASDVV